MCSEIRVPVNVNWLKRDLRRLLLPGIVARQYHYLGSSWEAYSVKADKCRTRKKYDERSGPRAGVMYDAQPWLNGKCVVFVAVRRRLFGVVQSLC